MKRERVCEVEREREERERGRERASEGERERELHLMAVEMVKRLLSPPLPGCGLVLLWVFHCEMLRSSFCDGDTLRETQRDAGV